MEIVVSAIRSVAENLAEDEERTRAAGLDRRSTLRLWWGDLPTVVIGHSEKIEQVADREACERLGVPILRRGTGGGTVLQGPGVLNYSLTGPAPTMLAIHPIFDQGAALLIAALKSLGLDAESKGISDVAVDGRKISGNAMAKRWGGLLLHGTLLYDLDFDLLESCLRHPPREPDYRQGRSHREFITTLKMEGSSATPRELESAVIAAAIHLSKEGAFPAFP